MKNVIYVAFNENVIEDEDKITSCVFNSKAPFDGKNKNELLAISKRFARNNRGLEATSQIDLYEIHTDGIVELNAKHLGQYEMGARDANFTKSTKNTPADVVVEYFTERKIEMI